MWGEMLNDNHDNDQMTMSEVFARVFVHVAQLCLLLTMKIVLAFDAIYYFSLFIIFSIVVSVKVRQISSFTFL